MPLFICSKCKCIENTALGKYWGEFASERKKPLCSECGWGKWHGKFPKEKYDHKKWRKVKYNKDFIERK